MIDELLASGVADWLMASEVAWVASSIGGASTPDEVRVTSLQLIEHMLDEHLLTVGDVGDDGFSEWGISTDEAMMRIGHEWAALGRAPSLGDICWFNLTEIGETLGESVLQRRSTTADSMPETDAPPEPSKEEGLPS
jgi:hypothetical protein